MAKIAANNIRKLLQTQADLNEREKRQREDKRQEKKGAQEDRAVLDARRVTKRKVAATPKQPKKTARESAAARKLQGRAEVMERKATEKEQQIQARRKQLISEGVTPRLLDDDYSAASDDMEWDNDQWEVVGHAVEWSTAKANFKVLTGMRSGDGEATEMWMWGQRQALLLDGIDKSVLDKYIEEKCEHPVYQEQLRTRVVRIKKTVEEEEKPKKRRACDHSSYDLGLSYHADPEVNPGWCAPGKFLCGVVCAGCGSPFVQKAPPALDGGSKQRGDPQVPSTNNAVYCCNNLQNRTRTSDEGCSHAYCKRCWDQGLLEASKSGVRASRRAY
jgi:hypothetical protein